MAVRYLVPDGKHLPVTGEDGKPDHHLMGAAWAALHGGYRGNKYSGPDKDKAIAELTRLYKEEGMDVPNMAAIESQIFVNVAAIDEKGRVQLAPYGDFLNIDGRGNRVIQRFEKPDAENIVNDFNRLANLPQRLLGLPWYIGHPDHPRFRNIHTDSRSYGRVKSLEAGDDGLYANVKFGGDGSNLLQNEAFSGHSVNWRCVPAGRDRGLSVYRPVALKSVGFTNEPAIPVIPASLANEELAELANDFDTPMPNYAVGAEPETTTKGKMTIPPKLKIIAGFKADDDVTMDQIITALEKAHPVQEPREKSMANQKQVELTIGDKKFSVVLANEESGDLQSEITKLADNTKTSAQNFANERKARATLVIDQLVTTGKIVTKDRDTKIEELANAQDFESKAKEFSNLKPIIKTTARTHGLAGRNAVINHDVQSRQSKLLQLVNERIAKFPNEGYENSFNAVCSSDEGASLFAQMQRPEAPETR